MRSMSLEKGQSQNLYVAFPVVELAHNARLRNIGRFSSDNIVAGEVSIV